MGIRFLAPPNCRWALLASDNPNDGAAGLNARESKRNRGSLLLSQFASAPI
jgi:hypothetical protein